METINQKTFKEITAELVHAGKYHADEWLQIAKLLQRIDVSKYWAFDGARSFTDWIKSNASKFDRKEAILWRYLQSLNCYEIVQEILTKSGIEVPAIEELPKEVSSEHIVILSKLSRVLNSQDFSDLAQRSLNGAVTRTELRIKWLIYRSLGDPSSRDDIEDKENYSIKLGIEALKQPTWLKQTIIGNTLNKYEVFADVGIHSDENSNDTFKGEHFDVVLATKKTKYSTRSIHIVEFKRSQSHTNSVDRLMAIQKYCNYLWVCLLDEAATKSFDELNLKEVGILLFKDDVDEKIQVIREAIKLEGKNIFEVFSVLLDKKS